jgi:hypothetical protein
LPPALPVRRPRRSPPGPPPAAPTRRSAPSLAASTPQVRVLVRDRHLQPGSAHSSRSSRTVPAWATALVISSLATSAPGSASPSSPQRPHHPHEAPASPGRGRRRAQQQRSDSRGGRARASASAASRLGWIPTCRASRGGGGCRPPAAGGAQHQGRVRLAQGGCRMEVNTPAHCGSTASTWARSQTMAGGCRPGA